MRSKVNQGLLVANIIGAVIYVLWASHSWVIPRERGLHAATGEPFVWALYVLPVWASFSAVDLIWGVLIVARRQWRNGLEWLLSACIWFIAVLSDFAHHG